MNFGNTEYRQLRKYVIVGGKTKIAANVSVNIKLSSSDKIEVSKSSTLYPIMQKILLREQVIDRNREHFWVVGLASDCRVLYIELISLGSIKETVVEPMEVYSLALQKRAVKIILVHNHPSGTLTPSNADKELTDRLIQVGKIVNVLVQDHLIISETSYLSFCDTGLMLELESSLKYVAPYMLLEKYEKDKNYLRSLEQEKAARDLKDGGVSEKLISKVTGLSLSRIRKL